MIAEAGASQRRQILLAQPRPIRGRAKRPEAPAPSQIDRSGEIQGGWLPGGHSGCLPGRFRSQGGESMLRILGADPLVLKLLTDPPH